MGQIWQGYAVARNTVVGDNFTAIGGASAATGQTIRTLFFFVIPKTMYHNSTPVIYDGHPRKPIDVWVSDSTVVKLSGSFQLGRSKCKKQRNFRKSAHTLEEKFSYKPMIAMDSV